MSKGITADAVARVAEYVRQRDIAMSGGNVGDVITTVYADTEGEPAHLDVNDLRALLDAFNIRRERTSPLVDGLRAAAARLYSYAGPNPRHWAVIDPAQAETELMSSGPVLVADLGPSVEVVGTLDGLVDREKDLIGLMSPQTAASLSALLELLADVVDYEPLRAVRWMPEAAALEQALNRQPDWATHPRGIRAPESGDD